MHPAPASIYKKLYAAFGPQHWWPAETPFEVMLGAILTQNTSWQNVERALEGLKKNNLLSPQRLYQLSLQRLAKLIRHSGYFNIKAQRLKEFLRFFMVDFQADISKMRRCRLSKLRQQLLAVKGIGPETADSILLYALRKPIFVVDAYTKRIFSRHGLISQDADYDEVQALFMHNLMPEVKLFNEYHALLVKLGKEYCLKKRGRCQQCPLK